MPAVTGRRVYGPGADVGSRAWREAQTFGGYLTTDVSAGLLYGTDLAATSAGGDMTHVDLGATISTLGTSPISDTVYWGRVKVARNGIAGAGSELHNVAIAGVRPDLVTPGDVHYCLSAYDTDTSQWSADDLLIDPFLWMRADAPGGPFTETQIREACINAIGIKGNGGTIRNAKVTHCQDQWQGTLSNGDDTPPGRFTLLEHTWLDTPLYYAGPLWPSQPEGTHSDSAQPQTGARVTFRGGLIGGPAMPESLDAEGCCLTWKQEVGTATSVKQVDVEWDRVTFWHASGGNPNVNIVYANSNDFSDGCSMHDCLFVERADEWYVNQASATAHLNSTTNRVISDPSGGSWSDLGPIPY
jgi:hypothetical protein